MGFLSINNVSKSFGSVEVLHDINIDIEEGEFLVLVGPSGCGKSTLLNMVAGLEDITTGEIAIRDRVVNGVHPSKRNIAMVFQSYALYPNMTVAQNMTFGLEMHGVPRPERERALADVAKLLQIDQLLARKPGQLSGGQRQRVAMGRALVRNPDVFLFDEPLSNLDAKLRVTMRTEIKKLHRKLGTTIVYVTHDQIEALTLSSRIAVMNDGYIQQLGTPKEVYDKPKNLFVATFMGSPSMNLIPAKMARKADGLFAEISTGMDEIAHLMFPEPSEALTNCDGKSVILGIRSEAITDIESADRNAQRIEHVTNQIIVTEPAGSDTFVMVAMGGHECISRMRSDTLVEAGQNVTLAINMEKITVFDPDTEERID